MSKKIFAALLCAAIMFGICSCGLLSTPKNQTQNFIYTVDDSLVQTIARAGTDAEDPLCTISITIKTDNGGTLADVTKTALLSKLKGKKIEFGDLPLNTPLLLKVSVSADGKLIYESLPQTFTLENENVKDIKAFVYRELDTPIMTWQEGYDEEDGYWYSEYISPGYVIPNGTTTYCFDGNNVLWTVDTDGYLWSSEKDEGPIPRLAYSESNNTAILDAKYDPITDKLVLMVGYYDYEDDEYFYFTTAVSPAELLTYEEETLTKDMFELKELNAPEIENEDWYWGYPDCYPYNGVAYMLFEIYDYDDDLRDLILRKVSLTTGEVLSETSLYDENNWPDDIKEELFGGCLYDECYQTDQSICLSEAQRVWDEELSDEDKSFYADFEEFETEYLAYYMPSSVFLYEMNCLDFADLFVYKDTILIPFTQQDYIDPQDYPPEADIPAMLIDRGGILLIDANTLQIKDIIGLAPIEDASISVPAYITGDYSAYDTHQDGTKTLCECEYGLYQFDNHITLYSDEEMENPLSLPLNTAAYFKMGTGTKDSQYLRNPEKIIAIKPKKLVLADTGRFYYIDEDELKKQRSSRMVTVDLETFALTSVDIVDDSIPQNDDFDVYFTISGTGDLPEDLNAIYGPDVSFDSFGGFDRYNEDIAPINLLSSNKISNLKLTGSKTIDFSL